MKPLPRPIPWDIYEEHLEEAAFLWGQRERALDAANYTLDEVIAGPEERLLAHLDGLVLGGRVVADRLLVPALVDDDLGKVSAATWVLLQAEDADHLDLVFDALVRAEHKDARAAMGRAFEFSSRADLPDKLLPRLKSSAPGVQAVIVNVVSGRTAGREPGKPPASALPLDSLLQARDPELLGAALRALGRAPEPAFARFVETALASPYLAIRDAAIETGVLLGMQSAWRTCRQLVARSAAAPKLPLALLAVRGDSADIKLVIKCLDVPGMRRDALWALGFAGTVEAAEAALSLIDDQDLCRLAGDSFATITGISIAGALAKPGTTDNSAPPESLEDDDAPLPEARPEDDLPIPNGDRVRAWWMGTKPKFSPEARFVFGRPAATLEAVQTVRATGCSWRHRIWTTWQMLSQA